MTERPTFEQFKDEAMRDSVFRDEYQALALAYEASRRARIFSLAMSGIALAISLVVLIMVVLVAPVLLTWQDKGARVDIAPAELPPFCCKPSPMPE